MIFPLFLKELRGLRPFVFLACAFLVIEIIELLWTPLEAMSFAERLDLTSTGVLVLQIALAFAMGSGLLVREIDDGTLGFLDSLPVTRRAVFAAKLMSAMLVLVILPLGEVIQLVLFQIRTGDSLNHAVHLPLLLAFFALSMLVTVVILTLGMLLGFLRYMGWLALGLCMIGVALLRQEAPHLAAAVNPAELLTLRFTGANLQWPTVAIWTQAAAALVFAGLAFALFSFAGAVLPRVRKWHKVRRYVLPPVVLVLVVVGFIGLSKVMKNSRDDDREVGTTKVDGAVFTDSAGAQATTRNYTFSYPATSSGRVAAFMDRADKTFDDVAALLGIEGGEPIDVDLWSSTANHAGTAYYSRIRMQTDATATMDTLAHETAHVLALRTAGGEGAQYLDDMLIFNEGLAEWVEGQLSGKPVERAHEFAAAVVSRRRLLTPRHLTDFAATASAVDDNLKYPLGQIFVAQFVQRYGPAAPRTLLKTLARDDFPRELAAYELWQTAFQMSGYDLDLVFDDYARQLKRLEVEYAQQVDALPRPRGSLVKTGKGYEVELHFDRRPAFGLAVVRFRPGNNINSALYRTSVVPITPTDDLRRAVPKRLIVQEQVCFQPGYMYLRIYIYEPWTCLPLSSASSGK
jgi:hypothetical protein